MNRWAQARVCIHKATLHKKVNCAADAVIWAEQQLVAIPEWLLKDQIARLDQEGQFESLAAWESYSPGL
jgi:hypothetical protein